MLRTVHNLGRFKRKTLPNVVLVIKRNVKVGDKHGRVSLVDGGTKTARPRS